MMIIISTILSAILLFLSSVYWYQKRSRFGILLNSFPHFKYCIPVLGNMASLSRKPDVLYAELRGELGKNNETVCMWAGIYGTLHVVTADDAEVFFSQQIVKKSNFYAFNDSWIKTGLLKSTGSKWQHRRKMLTPAFHVNILRNFVEIFGEQCNKLTDRLKKECEKLKTNIIPILEDTTLQILCETTMGIKIEENVEYQDYLHAVRNYNDTVMQRVLQPWLYPNIVYCMTGLYRKEWKLAETLHGFTTTIIKNRKTQLLNRESFDSESKRHNAFLDLLISESRRSGKIDDEGIKEEVDSFMIAGFDTITAALTFALLVLAHHPDIQHKITQELSTIFGDSERLPTFEDLQNMKYLECVTKECLRLYPSVPIIGRKIDTDIQLTHHVAPAGADIFIHIYHIHRNSKYFPDPEKFDPDRFLPENSIGRHPYAFIPFSAGSRNCIGKKFAMLEMKSIFSLVFRNFTLEPIDSLKKLNWNFNVSLSVNGPLYIKFKSRI